MSNLSQLRAMASADRVARIRPVTAASLVAAVMGLAIGAAYLGGTAAKASIARDRAERIDGATAAGFTEEALAAAAGGLDESALAIARRHDPYTVAGGAQRDRQAELLTARLEQLKANGGAGLRRASLSAPAAQPFRLGGALDASRDLDCLTQAVYYEARGEGRAGMRAVAQVVLNRARHPAFPKTVCGVVFQGAARRVGCQFSFTCNGSMRATVNRAAWNRARDIASAALSGSVYSDVGVATHFHTTAVAPQWRSSLIRVGQVGDHVFYRFGGRSGSSAAFTYAARRSSASDIQQPQLVQASLDPITPVREAGAVAYNLLVQQEGRQTAERASAASTLAPAAEPAAPATTTAAPIDRTQAAAPVA